jgi:hypothetical protein
MSLPQHGHFGCAGTTATDADWRTQWINNLFSLFGQNQKSALNA